ncbi:hypothetical protein [Tolypothrix sp. VBCCA 56010]|uniref:hypothetical protein n=1 Tax=Tolypothrix sp. VBCCA 56010 TaxID=3137731 RepID=UPI003D7C9D95
MILHNATYGRSHSSHCFSPSRYECVCVRVRSRSVAVLGIAFNNYGQTMYFGFDGNTEGFEKILTRIADNRDGGKHDRKEVRAYAGVLAANPD